MTDLTTINLKVSHVTSKKNLLKIRYGWSKHGGGRNIGITEVDTPEWVCQSCGQPQIKGMPFYEIPFEDLNTEFIKICAHCENRRTIHKLMHVHELLRFARLSFSSVHSL